MTAHLIEGAPPTLDDLTYLATVNYGAYTSFRFEPGGVRGLARHLARLDVSAVALFGEPLDEARLRDLIRLAVAEQDAGWLRITLFSPEIVARSPSWRGRPKVMTIVSPPPSPLAESLRLRAQVHARHLPATKHTGILDLIQARRVAREAGFDDALFVDRDGVISEGATWNIGFLRGDRVIWPQAPMLAGVTQDLINAGLPSVALTSETRPVRLADLAAFDAAFICNSATPACAVTAIGDHQFDVSPHIPALAVAWAFSPAEMV